MMYQPQGERKDMNNLVFKLLNVEFPGMIVFQGQELFVSARQFRERQDVTIPSSPQWVKTLVVGTSLRAAINAAVASRVSDEPDPACTGSSRNATLIVGKEDGSIQTFAPVEVLVTEGEYKFAAPGGVQHVATRVEATTERFSDSGHAHHKTWLVMSDLCESLFTNIPHGEGQSA
jgi:hypothetical protein